METYTPGKPLPDTEQWVNRYEIDSTTKPGDKYVLARNKKTGLWHCGCNAFKFRRTCTHVKSLDLPTPPEITPKPRKRKNGGR